MKNDIGVASRQATVRNEAGVPVGGSSVFVTDEIQTPHCSAGPGNRPVHQVGFETVVSGRGEGPPSDTDRVAQNGQYPGVADATRVHGSIAEVARQDAELRYKLLDGDGGLELTVDETKITERKLHRDGTQTDSCNPPSTRRRTSAPPSPTLLATRAAR